MSTTWLRASKLRSAAILGAIMLSLSGCHIVFPHGHHGPPHGHHGGWR